MTGKISAAAVAVLLAAGAGASLARPAAAQNLVEQSAEARMQIDFHVPDAALKAMLPAGVEPPVPTAGAPKAANLPMIFIEPLAGTAPARAPAGSGRIV